MTSKIDKIGILLVLATGATWGGAWVTARAAAHEAPTTWMAVGRFVVAAIALGAVAGPLRQPISTRHDRNTWLHLLGMAATGAIGYNLFFMAGVSFAPASDGSVVTPGLAGIFGMIWAFMLDKAKPRKNAVQGAVLSTLGVAFVGWVAWSLAGGVSGDRFIGVIFFVLAAFVWGIYTALSRRIAGRISAVEGVFWASLLGAVILMLPAYIVAGAPDQRLIEGPALLNILFLGLASTAIGFVTFYMAVHRLGVDRVAPTLGLVPVFGVLGGVIFLGETLFWQHAAGAALVLFGILVASRKTVPN